MIPWTRSWGSTWVQMTISPSPSPLRNCSHAYGRVFRRPLVVAKTAQEHTVIECGPIKIDVSQHAVFFNANNVELTKKEYDLLHYLVQNKGIALSRDQILDEVWGYDYYGDTNVVDVYIRYLRTKIDNAYDIKLIHTIRGRWLSCKRGL